jgi:hypothetical protein
VCYRERVKEILLALAAQAEAMGPPAPPSDVWPYWVACGALSSAIAALFGVFAKAQRDHALQIERINSEHQKANEERSRRISSEFDKRDSALLDMTTRVVTAMERAAAELKIINERERGGR